MSNQNLTPAAEYRRYKHDLAVMALTDMPPEDAAQICCAILEGVAAGMPDFDPWGGIRENASFWADIANPAELECYFVAALRTLGRRSLATQARKRLFKELWRSFTDTDRAAFIKHVSGSVS